MNERTNEWMRHYSVFVIIFNFYSKKSHVMSPNKSLMEFRNCCIVSFYLRDRWKTMQSCIVPSAKSEKNYFPNAYSVFAQMMWNKISNDHNTNFIHHVSYVISSPLMNSNNSFSNRNVLHFAILNVNSGQHKNEIKRRKRVRSTITLKNKIQDINVVCFIHDMPFYWNVLPNSLKQQRKYPTVEHKKRKEKKKSKVEILKAAYRSSSVADGLLDCISTFTQPKTESRNNKNERLQYEHEQKHGNRLNEY